MQQRDRAFVANQVGDGFGVDIAIDDDFIEFFCVVFVEWGAYVSNPSRIERNVLCAV